MTYTLKTVLYFILGILGLGSALILAVVNPDFPLTGMLAFFGFALIVTGWFRVFHKHTPPKKLSLILGCITIGAFIVGPLASAFFGLPVGIVYASLIIAAFATPPYVALGIRNDVASFNAERKREEIEEDTILHTPLLSAGKLTPKTKVNPKDVVSLPKEEFDDMLQPLKLNNEDFIPKIDTLALKPDTPKQADVPSDKRLLMFFVPKNLKATDLEVDQYISFIHNDEDGQHHITGTIINVQRDTGLISDQFPEGRTVFQLDTQTQEELDADVYYLTDSDDEAFRHMGQLEDAPETPEPRWTEMLREEYSPSFETTPTKAESIEKMLADAAENTDIDLEDTPTKSATLPADPFTEVLEEALTGPLPESTFVPEYTAIKVPAIHIDPTDPKWKGTLTPETHEEETFIKFRKVQPGQTIQFREEDKHYLADAKEVTGTVTHAKIIEDTDGLLMDITIDGPDAGTYPVISNHNAVLLDAIGKERIDA